MGSMRATCIGTACVAASILLSQVAFTRILAVMMWHHFTYMVISLALLGFGAAGAYLTVRRDAARTEDPSASLSSLSLAYGVSLTVSLCFVTRIRIDSLLLWDDKRNILALVLIFLLLSIPFFLGGLVLGRVLSRAGRRIHGIYFADLLGSAVGGGASVMLLNAFPSTAVIGLASLVAVCGALAFGWPCSWARRGMMSVATLLVGVVFVSMAGGCGFLKIPPLDLRVPFAPGKEFGRRAERVELRMPGALSEIDIAPEKKQAPMIGGNFGNLDTVEVEARLVGQDGTAPTMLYRNASDVSRFPFLDDSQTCAAHVAHASHGGRDPEVLVIGAGGGVDVMVALAHGASSVTAVEVNGAMVRAVTGTYDRYLGGLFTSGPLNSSQPVELVHADGRSFARRSGRDFDIIQLSGVDSFTALSSGAYSLSESYLYTVEAVRDLYGCLKEGGYLSYSRFILNHPRKPRETLRLANIARVALEEEGVGDPAAHLAVFQGFGWASTLIKRGEFTDKEMVALATFAEREGFSGFVFNPLDRHPAEDARLSVRAVESRMRGYLEKGVLPALQGRDVGVFSGGLSRAWDARDRGENETFHSEIRALVNTFEAPERESVSSLLYTVVDRAVELSRADTAAMARTRGTFRTVIDGTPRERGIFEADYEYDVSACRDDRPFFFNYYRPESLFDRSAAQEDDALGYRYHSDFPVGHMVLAISLVTIAILAALFILLPLRFVRSVSTDTSRMGAGAVFLYFAALGCGFMFVEMSLMQRLIVFLGHPTHAMSVVLSVLLGSAGAGAWISGRLALDSRPRFLALGGAVVLGVLGISLVSGPVLSFARDASFSGRILVSILLIAPVGLLLGAPFPTGMRMIQVARQDLVPWAWGINGFLSVFASLLAVVLAMSRGFPFVLQMAAIMYGIGFAALGWGFPWKVSAEDEEVRDGS